MGFSKEGQIKPVRNSFTKKLWNGRTLFFSFRLFYTSYLKFVLKIVSYMLNVVSFEISFNDWIMYSLLQISFQEKFELIELIDSINHLTGFYLILPFTEKKCLNICLKMSLIRYIRLNLSHLLNLIRR